MFLDRRYRVVSYHDSWISIDPVQGCPYRCVYCVLRHADRIGKRPEVMISPEECIAQLLNYPLYRPGHTRLAIGNETDMLHPHNVDYLIRLLTEMSRAKITNPIALITKAPLSDHILGSVRSLPYLRLILFLSYAGLGRQFEPNFADEQLRANFVVARRHGLPIIHYWRPLLPENTTLLAIRRMLAFVSSAADATVMVGLKLHPELTRILIDQGGMRIPEEYRDQTGEWLESETIDTIYREARQLCPGYPLYRHTSCALARVLEQPSHTATMYRADICPPSHCPVVQRNICEAARQIPDEPEIVQALRVLDRPLSFERHLDRVIIHGEVTQEEFAYLLHSLNCPLHVGMVQMQNLYHGSIYAGQPKAV